MKRWSVALLTLIVGFGTGTFFVGTGLHGQNAKPPVNATPPALDREPASYRAVVKKVLPAVVSIEAKAKVTRAAKAKPGPRAPLVVPFGDQQLPEEFRRQLPDDFRRFFEEHGREPGRMPVDPDDSPRLGFGSGFFVDPAGVVVTNYHVVDGADQVTVETQDGRKFRSKSIRLDRRTDLAVVVLDTTEKNFPYLELGDSDAMEIGDRVLAVGAPFGLAGSVTHGIVSAKGRNGLNMNMYEDFIQTDAAINPGNSGGPLVNIEGKVIGINAAIKSRSGGFQGIGLAVGSNLAKKVVDALRTEGVVRRGYLGVQIRELSPEVSARLGLKKDVGVVVGEVFENTPAAKAGLQAGDVITAIAGKAVKDGRVLQNVVAELPLGKPSPVEVVREGKAVTVDVTVEEQPGEFGTARAPAPRQPAAAPESTALEAIGVEVSDLSGALAEDLGFRKGTKGAVITKVESTGVAAEAGLRRGMLITKVENRKVSSAAEAREALEGASLARGVLLQVQSPQGGTTFVLLRSEATGEQ